MALTVGLAHVQQCAAVCNSVSAQQGSRGFPPWTQWTAGHAMRQLTHGGDHTIAGQLNGVYFIQMVAYTLSKR